MPVVQISTRSYRRVEAAVERAAKRGARVRVDYEAEVQERFRRWIRKLWFRPSALKRLKSAAATGVYLPAWTFDAAAECDWTADSGTYYYTTETYRDSEGKRRTRQVRHTRWRPAADPSPRRVTTPWHPCSRWWTSTPAPRRRPRRRPLARSTA